MTNQSIVPVRHDGPVPDNSSTHAESLLNNSGQIQLGDWYWRCDESKQICWLGCITAIGSNCVTLQEPEGKRGYRSERIHLTDCGRLLRKEDNVDLVLANRVQEHQAAADTAMARVRAITARLGVARQPALSNDAPHSSTELVALSAATNIDDYKTALTRAKDKELPALFEEIRLAHEEVARWMGAKLLPARAQAGLLQDAIKQIEGRIFNVGLYAGLTESVVRCCDGAPAQFHDKLHLFQRKLFMDEECLLNYRTGGMEFKDIEAFDRWLCEPVNRDRILPRQRCMVAMQVRRNVKERESTGNLRTDLINFQIAQSDGWTYLYIRNGGQVHRLCCDLEFDDLIFPSRETVNLSEPMMFKMWGGRKVQEMITRADFELRCTEELEHERNCAEWERANPRDAWLRDNPNRSWEFANPFGKLRSHFRFRADDWHPFDPSSVYFDEASEQIAAQIQKYNRVALLIQGLFDRSDALHPHPTAKTWTADGFAAAAELVYDGTGVLNNSEPPDFDAYRERCNETLNAESVVIGQEAYWLERETEKECRRLDADWRNSSEYRPTSFRPRGNPGPGYVAKIHSWKPRARTALFAWMRKRQTDDPWAGKHFGEGIRATITVPASALFNVSAYTPGDYKRFFADHRTRAQYLKWAPMLLAAEEFHAGNLKLDVPDA